MRRARPMVVFYSDQLESPKTHLLRPVIRVTEDFPPMFDKAVHLFPFRIVSGTKWFGNLKYICTEINTFHVGEFEIPRCYV